MIPVCAYNVGVDSSDLDEGYLQQGDSTAKDSSVRNPLRQDHGQTMVNYGRTVIVIPWSMMASQGLNVHEITMN